MLFKFLLMQPNIELDDKLICYAISGRNYEIIHFIENNENFTYKYELSRHRLYI